MRIQSTGMSTKQECKAAWEQNGHLADFSNGKHLKARYLPPLSACFVEIGDDTPMLELVRIFVYMVETRTVGPRQPDRRVRQRRVIGVHNGVVYPMTRWEQELRR